MTNITTEPVKKLSLPDPSDNDAQIASDLKEYGLAIIPGAIVEQEISLLRDRVIEQAEMERLQGVAELSATGSASELQFCEPESEEAPFQAISFLPNKGQVFLDLMTNRRITSLVEQAFNGTPFTLAMQAATIVMAGGKSQVVHSDQQAWPFVTPIPVLMNCMVCLTDFTEEMGSTRFVPGSHNDLPPGIGFNSSTGCVENTDLITTQAVQARAGDIILWEGRTWHGQGASTSDTPRMGIIQTYVMHMVKPQDIYSAIVHDDIYHNLTATEKEALGFEVHFSYAGKIAPRNANDVRTNTNYRYPFVPELKRNSSMRAVRPEDLVIDHPETIAKLKA